MLDPDLTSVLKRRVGAFAIDAGLIGLATAVIARTQIESFSWTSTDPTTGQPIWTEAQFQRLSELAQGFNRAFDWNDTKYVIDTQGIVITLLTAGLLSLIFFVLLPATSGWSPGKRLLGLRVIGLDGRDLALPGHLVRTAFGVIDLVPYLIPGLLGFLVARSSPLRQRIGDRFADSTVVDARRPVRMIADDVWERSHLEPPPIEPDSMVDVGSRLGSEHLTGSGPAIAAAAPFTSVPSETDVSAAQRATRPEHTTDPYASGQIDAPPPSAQDLLEDFREDEASWGPDGLEGGGRVPRRWDEPIPQWDEPIAEPAPVWHPMTEQSDWPVARGGASESTPVPSEPERRPVARSSPGSGHPDTGPAGTGQPDIGHTDTGRAGADQPVESESRSDRVRAAQAAAAAGQPVWSDDWQAWLYWEPSAKRWLRHDDVTGSWVAIG